MATQLKQPLAGTVHWFDGCIRRSQIEDFAESVVVTPGLAAVMLEQNNCNRPLSDEVVNRYARDMLNGKWKYNMEAIIVSNTGELNNGQHRLHAVIAANKPQKFLIAFGAERETRTTVDQGRARTAGHYLSMLGVKNANYCAAIAAMVLGYECSDGAIKNISKYSHAEIVTRVRADDLISEAATFAASVNKYARGVISASRIGFLYYIFADINSTDAEHYLKQVCIGENIKRGDPAFAVRQALNALEDRSVNNQAEIVMRGWNAFRQGRRLTLAKNLGSLPAVL